MALSSPTGGGTGNLPRFATGSVQSWWQLAHSNAKATAETSTASPLQIDQDGARWIKVPQGAVRVHLRLKWTAGATVTTSPVVSLYGAGDFDSDSKDAPTNEDGAPQLLASGVTLTGTKSVDDDDGATDTFDYSDAFDNSGDGYDLEGASWLLVPCTTAAAGPTSVQIEAKFLN